MFNYKQYLFVLTILISYSVSSQNRGFYDNNEFKRQRHEINIGIGTSNCLTDLGGNYSVSGVGVDGKVIPDQIAFLRSIYDTDLNKSRPVFNAAYIYHFKNKINFRANLAFARIQADDAESLDLGRINRNLNFKSNILEISAMAEFYLLKPSTGTKFDLKDVQGHKLAPNILSTIGVYFVGGIGGFYFNPKAQNNFTYNSLKSEDNTWYALRRLHTEGQGSQSHNEYIQSNFLDTTKGYRGFGQKKNGDPKTYKPIAICFPLGFGIEKAFNSDIGIKIEAGYRFTTTDYLDDVSGFYASRADLAEIQNSLKKGNADLSQNMSGTQSGDSYETIIYAKNRVPGEIPSHPLHGSPGEWVVSDADLANGIMGNYSHLAYNLDETSYERGYQRGSPKTKDSYVFLNVSFYKKFSSHGKVYKSIHSKEKRKIKASF